MIIRTVTCSSLDLLRRLTSALCRREQLPYDPEKSDTVTIQEIQRDVFVEMTTEE